MTTASGSPFWIRFESGATSRRHGGRVRANKEVISGDKGAGLVPLLNERYFPIATRSVESFGRKSSQSSLQALIADTNASLARHPSAVVQSSHAPNEMNL